MFLLTAFHHNIAMKIYLVLLCFHIWIFQRGELWTGYADSGELCLWHTNHRRPFKRISLPSSSGVTCMIRVKDQVSFPICPRGFTSVSAGCTEHWMSTDLFEYEPFFRNMKYKGDKVMSTHSSEICLCCKREFKKLWLCTALYCPISPPFTTAMIPWCPLLPSGMGRLPWPEWCQNSGWRSGVGDGPRESQCSEGAARSFGHHPDPLLCRGSICPEWFCSTWWQDCHLDSRVERKKKEKEVI